MRKFLILTVTCHRIMLLMYVNSNYFSPSRNVLAEGPLAEMYRYCKNWKRYEDLDRGGDDRRFWDDRVKEGLKEILTLRPGVLVQMEMEMPKNGDEKEKGTTDKDETETSDKEEKETSDK